MGRVRRYIKVNGRRCWTLFDPGAENTYVVEGVAKGLNPEKLPRPRPARLGGKSHRIRYDCRLVASIDRRRVAVPAYVIDEIGIDRKARRPFEILFGARAMQDWGLELNLKNKRVEFPYYPGEFVEFAERLSSEGGRP